MPLSETIRKKILLIEEVINFPTSLLSHKNYHWENLPMVPYSDLTEAVSSLVRKGRKVVIITGFYVPVGDPPATETDGPPGALALAKGLKQLGMEVSLLSDEYTLAALKAGLKVIDLPEDDVPVLCFPLEHSDHDHTSRMMNEESQSSISIRFAQDFFKSLPGQDLTHLVYIERVGPNHTLESFIAQQRRGKPPLREFETLLPPPIRNRCFSSRLEDITRFTAKTHFLLELAGRLGLPVESIGIGDRGNEIGAGKIPWEVFKQNSTTNREAVFCSRVKTDALISCGISNWGGYALLAGVALAEGRLEILEKVTPEQEGTVLDYLVRYGPAVDGITCKPDHSVDGIEFDDYMMVIERIKEIALE
jgi:D-glutamate cyclase